MQNFQAILIYVSGCFSVLFQSGSYSRIQFHQCWSLKNHLGNACEIKKFWPLTLQSAELYHILLAFLY